MRFDSDCFPENQLASLLNIVWQAPPFCAAKALGQKVLDDHLGAVHAANETIGFLVR